MVVIVFSVLLDSLWGELFVESIQTCCRFWPIGGGQENQLRFVLQAFFETIRHGFLPPKQGACYHDR